MSASEVFYWHRVQTTNAINGKIYVGKDLANR